MSLNEDILKEVYTNLKALNEKVHDIDKCASYNGKIINIVVLPVLGFICATMVYVALGLFVP